MSTNTSQVSLRLPAALLRIWHGRRDGEGEPSGWSTVVRRLEERLAARPGIHRLGAGLWAVVPVAGDGEVVDAAAAAGRSFLAELERRGGSDVSGAPEVRLLIHPGWVASEGGGTEGGTGGEERVRLVPDDLTRHLDRTPPALASGGVHLTARAVLALETPWRCTPGPSLRGPADRELPVFRLGNLESPRSPWRNREIWGRPVPWVERTEPEAAFKRHGRSPGMRVQGPLGSGKTRLVMEVRGEGFAVLHTAVASNRAEAGPTASRLLHLAARSLPEAERELARKLEQLAGAVAASPAGRETLSRLARALLVVVERQGPLTVVLDRLERASDLDWTLAEVLLESARATPALRLVLVGRSGRPWSGMPERLRELPVLRVPPLEEGEARSLLERLLPGVSLPDPVREALVRGSGGHPFVLEEVVADLIHRRRLRRFFGALVYSGGEEELVRSTVRWSAQVEAELLRLGGSLPARLLSLVGEPVPPRELTSASRLLGRQVEPGWEDSLQRAGWLRTAESPWGPGVEPAFAALAIAWRGSLEPEVRVPLRRTLGELLAGLGSGEGLWHSYRLLSGDPEAIPLLLQTTDQVRGKERGGPPEGMLDELVDALRTELDHHRRRGGDPEVELRLLWRLVPLARRSGRLAELGDELERALALAQGEPRRVVALSLLKAELAHGEGRFKEAEEILRRALAHADVIAEPQKALLLVQLGHMLMRQERNEEAAALFHRILPMLEAASLSSLAATCHFHLGNLALSEHRLEEAERQHERALAARRRAGAPKGVSASLAALGAVSLARGRYPEALERYREAETEARKTGDAGELAFARRGMGRTLARLGDFPAAATQLRHCLELREQGDDVVGEVVARLEVAESYLHLNRPSEALEEARKAAFRASLIGGDSVQGDAAALLGRIQAHRRKPEEARKHFLAALDHHLSQGAAVAAAFTRAALIRLALDQEQREDLPALVADLATFLEREHYPELGERLDFELYRSLRRLDRGVESTRDALFYLRRAYRRLMEKTGHLQPALRNRFLFQVPAHEAIVGAATREGLAEELDVVG